MENRLSYSRPLYWMLLAFAATAVASIFLQNVLIGLLWPCSCSPIGRAAGKSIGLAQLVQSACFTRKRSLVRVQ